MKEYDVIAIGTGSAMNIISALPQVKPGLKIAVIDKDEPGGICLTRGCIPTKILLYPAELIGDIKRASMFGIDVELKKVDFEKVMERMRSLIYKDINMIRRGLSHTTDLDYYPHPAEFVAPYTLKVGKETIKGKKILLCTGSRPAVPPIKGLEKAGYLTSDSVIHMKKRPESLIIIGGGYIAAEYGYFFSAMGTKVTMLQRNVRILKTAEPEVSELAKKELGRWMDIRTGQDILEVKKGLTGGVKVVSRDRRTGQTATFTADRILVATGRASNSDILKPEKGGIATDERGWIKVNEYLQTSKPNVWAMGDATGKHMFKHVANYESMVVFYNAFLGRKMKVDYHAVPWAVFTVPEIAGVGMLEAQAVKEYGKENIVIGFQKYENTAKGEAMNLKDYFVKVILTKKEKKILGAHIIGPQASVLIQEIVNLMYTPEGDITPIRAGMHIHPSLSEVVDRAFGGFMSVDEYHAMLKHGHGHVH